MNITNELWKGNIANQQEINRIIENKFSPVTIPDMYANVPQTLLDLKGALLISFAKAKINSSYGASFSIKNLFGLVPDPNRYVKYHGDDGEKLLSKSIVYVHKIYQSLFDVKFVVESVYEYCTMNWDTEISQKMSQKIEGDGTIIAGNNGYEIDSKAEEIYKAKMIGPLANLLDKYQNEIEG